MDFMILEATCSRCGQTYNPSKPGEPHYTDGFEGEECGGLPLEGSEGGYIR